MGASLPTTKPPSVKHVDWNAITGKAPKLTPKAQAIKRILEFSTRTAPEAWIHLTRKDVADGLYKRVYDPRLIDQGGASLCGPSAFIYDRAKWAQSEYARFVIELFETGSSRLGKLLIKASPYLRVAPVTKVHPADWVPIASIRDSENSMFQYDSEKDLFPAITMPREIDSWLRKVGYTDVLKRTTLLGRKRFDNAMEVNLVRQKGYRIFLFINHKMLEGDSKVGRSALPTHWVVLESAILINKAVDTVSMTVYSWGALRHATGNQVSGAGATTIPLSQFKRHYFGFVAAKG